VIDKKDMSEKAVELSYSAPAITKNWKEVFSDAKNSKICII